MTRTVGTAHDVVTAFVDGRSMRTSSAPVPGGRRIDTAHTPEGLALYSYRTIVAIRLNDGRIAITPRRYSVTTSKLMGRIVGAMARSGYQATDDIVPILTAIPGRWGGYGPAWASSSHETLPFRVWGR